MNAARFYGGKDIRLETLPEPTPEVDQVLVQVKATGICGSDLHGFHFQPKQPLPPRTGGHELTGQIISIGQQVTKDRSRKSQVGPQPKEVFEREILEVLNPR